MFKEKRQFTRFTIEYPILIKRADGTECVGKIQNLSMKGILITPVLSLEQGETIQFSFPHSTRKKDIRVNGTAIVVRTVGENSFGLRLTEVDLESLTHLRRLVELNLGDSDKAMEETAKWLDEG
jgi:hypothetical protein